MAVLATALLLVATHGAIPYGVSPLEENQTFVGGHGNFGVIMQHEGAMEFTCNESGLALATTVSKTFLLSGRLIKLSREGPRVSDDRGCNWQNFSVAAPVLFAQPFGDSILWVRSAREAFELIRIDAAGNDALLASFSATPTGLAASGSAWFVSTRAGEILSNRGDRLLPSGTREGAYVIGVHEEEPVIARFANGLFDVSLATKTHRGFASRPLEFHEGLLLLADENLFDITGDEALLVSEKVRALSARYYSSEIGRPLFQTHEGESLLPWTNVQDSQCARCAGVFETLQAGFGLGLPQATDNDSDSPESGCSQTNSQPWLRIVFSVLALAFYRHRKARR